MLLGDSPPPPPRPQDSLSVFNNAPNLDFRTLYDRTYRDFDLDNDPYSNVEINSKYYDMYSIPDDTDNHNAPLFISINIQRLNSKYEELRNQIVELSSKNISVDVIAIQETWEICLPEALTIPGFQPILYKTPTRMRGGGVGFYVRNGLNAKIIDNLSPFEQKIFEAITIQVTYPKKSILLTSAYRSNGRAGNLTPAQQFERFQVSFDELLYNLNRSRTFLSIQISTF
jgi:hypothetical protein